MNIPYNDMLNMTWREFDYLSIGYIRRIERGFDEVRHLIAAMYNSSGMSKKTIRPKDVMKLALLDAPSELKRMSKNRYKKLKSLWQ